jgi:hypothetical protein
VLKAIVILIGLIVSTSIHAQPTSAWSQPGAYQAPQSAWNDGYQPPKSQWSSPKPTERRRALGAQTVRGSRQRDKRPKVGGPIQGIRIRQRARGIADG